MTLPHRGSMKHQIRLTWRCPKHRTYNPSLHGQGAIKGGCQYCQRLFDEYRRHHSAMREWADQQETA